MWPSTPTSSSASVARRPHSSNARSKSWQTAPSTRSTWPATARAPAPSANGACSTTCPKTRRYAATSAWKICRSSISAENQRQLPRRNRRGAGRGPAQGQMARPQPPEQAGLYRERPAPARPPRRRADHLDRSLEHASPLRPRRLAAPRQNPDHPTKPSHSPVEAGPLSTATPPTLPAALMPPHLCARHPHPSLALPRPPPTLALPAVARS